MSIQNPHDDRFYLGFNRDTGQLVEVVATRKGKVHFGPEEFFQLLKDDLAPDLRKDLKVRISALWNEIRESSIPDTKLVLTDNPGNTICGGSCGGIPFKIC